MNTKNHPGVYIPPPLIYAAFFLLSFLMQKRLPVNDSTLHNALAKTAGGLLLLAFVLFSVSAMKRFFISKNTLVTIKPARSLETSGIYSFTRNPMYVSLVCLYSGLAVFFGNWWTFIFLPVLIVVIQWYVIRREELYLQQAFGSHYDEYKSRVRRWI
jgi:protein-S-isoprenylcysteine O-methyltransferase Ste14